MFRKGAIDALSLVTSQVNANQRIIVETAEGLGTRIHSNATNKFTTWDWTRGLMRKFNAYSVVNSDTSIARLRDKRTSVDLLNAAAMSIRDSS